MKAETGEGGLRTEETVKAVVTVLTIGIFLWIAATSQIRGQILGVLFLALIVWSLYPGRHLESSILVVILLSFFQASLSLEEFIGSLFATYGGSGLWIILSGFVLAKGMEASGLGRRIALWIATSIGGSPEMIVLSVALANLAVAPLSPSTTAKAFLLLPICRGLVDAFSVEKGSSRYGAAVMLMAMAANNVCSTAFLTATVPNPISADYIEIATGVRLDWISWFRMGFPLALLILVIAWLLCVRMFRPEVEASPEVVGRIRDLRSGLGPFSRGEKVVAIFFSLALMLWITDGLYGFNSGLVSLALSLLLFVPGLGVMRVEGFAGEVPWGSIALFAASMFLAKAVGSWRALDPVAMRFFGLLGLSELTPMVFVPLTVLAAMLLHVFFTSTTVYATVMVPLAISITELQGLPAQLVSIPIAFLAPVAVILPVNTIPNIVFYKSGHFTQAQIIAYGLATSLVSVLIILLIGLPYWSFIGLI